VLNSFSTHVKPHHIISHDIMYHQSYLYDIVRLTALLPDPPDSVSRMHWQNLRLESTVSHVHRVILSTLTNSKLLQNTEVFSVNNVTCEVD